MNNELKSFIGKIITPVGDKYEHYVTLDSLRVSLARLYASRRKKRPEWLADPNRQTRLRGLADELERLGYIVNRRELSGKEKQPACMTVAGHILGPDMNKVLAEHYIQGKESDYILFSDLVAKMRELLEPHMFEIIYNASSDETAGSFAKQLTHQGIERYREKTPKNGDRMVIRGWKAKPEIKPKPEAKKPVQDSVDKERRMRETLVPTAYNANDVMEQVAILRGDVRALGDEIKDFRQEMSHFAERIELALKLKGDRDSAKKPKPSGKSPGSGTGEAEVRELYNRFTHQCGHGDTVKNVKFLYSTDGYEVWGFKDTELSGADAYKATMVYDGIGGSTNGPVAVLFLLDRNKYPRRMFFSSLQAMGKFFKVKPENVIIGVDIAFPVEVAGVQARITKVTRLK